MLRTDLSVVWAFTIPRRLERSARCWGEHQLVTAAMHVLIYSENRSLVLRGILSCKPTLSPTMPRPPSTSKSKPQPL